MTFEFDDFDVRDRFYIVEEKYKKLNLVLENMPVEDLDFFREVNFQAYIYHDSAIDGKVVTKDEIESAFTPLGNSYYQRSRVFQEIRNHRMLLESIIEESRRYQTLDTAYISRVVPYEEAIQYHERLYGEISKLEPGKYRQNMPVHSMYFHDFIEPDLIDSRLQELCQKTEKPDFRGQHPINQAVLFHCEFMKIFPFSYGSGRVARLFMNGFLMQGCYPHAVIHSSERQRYYESLRDGPEEFREVLLDNMISALEAQLKFVENIQENRPTKKVIYAT